MFGKARGLGCAAILAFAAGPLGATAESPKTPESREPRVPGSSVFLLTIDTLRQDQLERGSGGRDATPYLDELAREGTYFTQCYAQCSWTLPSMLSLVTSLEPWAFSIKDGVLRDDQMDANRSSAKPVWRREYFADSFVTLAELLRDAGYRTAGITTNGHLVDRQGFPQGFEFFDEERCMWGTAECALGLATDVLLGHEGEKLFLWVHLFDPHHDRLELDDRKKGPVPYTCPPGYEDHFSESETETLAQQVLVDYARKIRYMDDRLRDFFEDPRLKETLDETLVVIAADHGEEFNEKGRWGHRPYLTNTLIHTPLIFRRPGAVPEERSSRVVGNLDVLPSILELVGLPVPEHVHGRSLLPVMKGEKLSPASIYGNVRRHRSDRHYLIDPRRGFKLVLNEKRGVRELYAFPVDSRELDDLSERDPEIADAMERDLRARLGEPFDAASPDPPPTTAVDDDELEQLRSLGYLD